MDSLFGLDRVSAHDAGLALLMTVYDPTRLAVVQSILTGEGIPFLFKERGAGGSVKIIAGYSVFGTDIFVRAEQLEEAGALFAIADSPAEDTENA